jgi:hypothetical protein
MALREIDGGPGYFSQFANSLRSAPSFFPIGVWMQGVHEPNPIPLDKEAGINVYVGLEPNSNLELVENGGMFVIPQADEWLGEETGNIVTGYGNSAANVGWLLWMKIDMVAGPHDGDSTLKHANRKPRGCA